MQRELLNQTMAIFDTPEKWNSYLELKNAFTQIRAQWINKLRNNISGIFNNNKPDGWEFKQSESDLQFQWYLKDFGPNSLSILMSYARIGLWAWPDNFDIQKINVLLQSDEYKPLGDTFPNAISNGKQWILPENGKFYFDSPEDGKFEFDNLLWYAEHKTDSFLKQLTEKVDRIRRDDTLTKFLREINQKTKK